MNKICPACNKEYSVERNFLQGLCRDCHKSLNSWILGKCESLDCTKMRTGLVLLIGLHIAEWLETVKKDSPTRKEDKGGN